MKKIQKDKNTIWEETGQLKVYNFPPSIHTYAYVTKVYTEYTVGHSPVLIESSPIYLKDMNDIQILLAETIARCSFELHKLLP
jgi:hypothetical protein